MAFKRVKLKDGESKIVDLIVKAEITDCLIKTVMHKLKKETIKYLWVIDIL